MSMDYCPSCGRQRAASDRFCGDCGAAYPERSDVTRMDMPAEVTRTDTPSTARPAADDPFASWYTDSAQPPRQAAPPMPPAPRGQTGWQPTETLYAAPPRQPGGFPPPPGQAGPVYGQPLGPKPSGGKRGVFLTVALVVVLGAGFGAYELVSMAGKNSTSQPPAARSSGAASTASTPAGNSSPRSPVPPTGSGTSSATGTTSPAGGEVATGPGVADNGATTAALGVLNHYFHGINTHNYTEYSSVLDAVQRAAQPESAFNKGYSSTQDTGMTLTSVADYGGELAATVTFTSHQNPAQSIDNSACNIWTLTLYLAQQSDGSYLMTHPPAGYHATHQDC
jgi:hypothetical protein